MNIIFYKVIMYPIIILFPLIVIANDDNLVDCKVFIDSEINRLEKAMHDMQVENKRKINDAFIKYKNVNTQETYDLAYMQFNKKMKALEPSIKKLDTVPGSIKMKSMDSNNNVCEKREEFVFFIDNAVQKYKNLQAMIFNLARTSMILEKPSNKAIHKFSIK